jgi:transcription elongation factor GreA
MRSLGLDVDGPVRWGSLPSSQAAGIFVVETSSPSQSAPIDPAAVRRWLERVPGLHLDGEQPTAATLAQRLASFWLPGQALLYVGRTSKSLAGRVAALYATELGHRRPHPGGHWLKALAAPERLRLWWAETDAPEEYEDALLTAFAEQLPPALAVRGGGSVVLPWANLESPSGDARTTGISGALLDADTTAAPSQVRRSDPSPTIRRRLPSPAAPRSPRRTSSSAATAGNARPGGSPPREQPTHLTTDGLASLTAELEHLRTVERPQVVERIKHARELGDLRENADYEAARNEQSFLEGRIQELERRLRTAVVIAGGNRTAITLGSRVRFELEGQPGELTIVGSTESDPASGRISAASPVGRALLGHVAGEEIAVTTPAATLRYRIIEVG